MELQETTNILPRWRVRAPARHSRLRAMRLGDRRQIRHPLCILPRLCNWRCGPDRQASLTEKLSMSVHSLKATFAGIAPFQASAFNDSVGVMQQIPIVQTRVRLLEFLESAVAKRPRT